MVTITSEVASSRAPSAIRRASGCTKMPANAASSVIAALNTSVYPAR
jgi:hypothetical protein